MTEIRTVTTLRSKRAEILASISLYEKRLAQARADLAHVTACIAIFEASGDGEELSKRFSDPVCSRSKDPIAQMKSTLALA